MVYSQALLDCSRVVCSYGVVLLLLFATGSCPLNILAVLFLDELDKVESYLKSLSSVPRFSMVTMFMSASSKSGKLF